MRKGLSYLIVGLVLGGAAIVCAQTVGDVFARRLHLNGNILSATAGTAAITVPNSTGTIVYKDTSDTFTNKTLNAESTGNVLTLPFVQDWNLATCDNAVAYPVTYSDHTSATDAPTPSCYGTVSPYAFLEFDDAATESIFQNFLLPSDWTGTLDLSLIWFTTATTGNVQWLVSTFCVADNEASDPSTFTYNAAQTITDAAKGTGSLLNTASQTTLTTTGCAAGELLFLKISRNPAAGGDTISASAKLVKANLTYRRAI